MAFVKGAFSFVKYSVVLFKKLLQLKTVFLDLISREIDCYEINDIFDDKIIIYNKCFIAEANLFSL